MKQAKTPADFIKKYPYDSVLRNSESETVARNIMKILARTGNQWREISMEEYETERMKDGAWSSSEERYFEKVKAFCLNAEAAQKFSTNW